MAEEQAGPVEIDRTSMQQTYANIAMVICTLEEVMLDFAIRDTDDPGHATGLQRIILSLPHALRLRDVLVKNLAKIQAKVSEDLIEGETDEEHSQ